MLRIPVPVHCMRALRTPALALAFTLSAACTSQDNAAARMAAASIPIASANAQEPATSEDSGHGAGFEYRLRYPEPNADWNNLDQALHAFGARCKQEFLAEVPQAAKQVRSDTARDSLFIEFSVATQTEEFVSALAQGEMYTDAAHRLPIVASFTLHLPSGNLVTLNDLFADMDAALTALSTEARRQLEARFEAALQQDGTAAKTLAEQLKQMRDRVARGTEPQASNFEVFLVDGVDSKAIGLTLIFAPYQVAAYADGTQQVEVPAKVFYRLLKPQYRDAFAVDASELGALDAAH